MFESRISAGATEKLPCSKNLCISSWSYDMEFHGMFFCNTHGKRSNLGTLICKLRTRLFLSVYVDDLKLAGKKQNIDPVWKELMKEVDLGEPTSFFDHVYLGCTQRECETRLHSNISSWSYGVEGHAKECVERYSEPTNKTTQQLYEVSTPCLDDHRFKEAELGSVGELS